MSEASSVFTATAHSLLALPPAPAPVRSAAAAAAAAAALDSHRNTNPKCDARELSPNHSPPWSTEKSSSTKLVPGAKNVVDPQQTHLLC